MMAVLLHSDPEESGSYGSVGSAQLKSIAYT